MILAVAGGTIPVAIGLLSRLIIDALATGHASEDSTLVCAGALALAATCLSVLPAAADYGVGSIKRQTSLLLQGRLFGAINRIPGLQLFEDPVSLDRLRIAQDVGETAPSQALQSVMALCQGIVTLLGFLTALWFIAPPLGVIVGVAAIPDVVFQLSLSHMRLSAQWKSAAHIRRRIFFAMLHVEEPAAREIRLFNFGPDLHSRMQAELRASNQFDSAVARRQFRLNSLSAMISSIAAGLGLLLAVAWTLEGHLVVGDIALYLAAVIGVQAGLGGAVQSISQLVQAEGGYRQYEAVLATPPGIVLAASPVEVPRLANGIEFRNVWFRYEANAPWILRGVDLVMPARATVALVGLNGAGKSTLAKLLCRFYDPDRGSVLWDGIDIREFEIDAYRAHLSASFQDYMCYDLTLSENIALSRASDSDAVASVRRAAEAATADTVASRLPLGYSTMLSRAFVASEGGTAGSLISGGEWQRVALARALMKDQADILILDEPGAGLDAPTEHSLGERLRALSWKPATFLIAHRMSLVRHSDWIAVLGDGRIQEVGTHGDLMRWGGTYAELFDMQASSFMPELDNCDTAVTSSTG
ncbi:MAG: ABC transporter ATP-binding protein [Candidatus Dormiibacterota bacterium]